MAHVVSHEQVGQDASELHEANAAHVFDVLLIFAKNWRRIALFTAFALILGLVIAFLVKPTYTANAIILPPQQQQSSATAFLGSLGAIASLGAGGGASSLLKTPGDMYVGILKSHTIADELIAEFHLEQVYHKKTLYDTRTALEDHTSFESEKDNLIHISVKDHNAERASGLANGYIDALYRMNSTLAISEASQRRLFFNQQVDEERNALNKAEDDLEATEVKTGIIELSGQAELIIRTLAQVQAQISADQVKLQDLLTSSTEQNPDVQRLRQEISTLQGQLSKLQDDQKRLKPGDTELPAGRVPENALEYARKLQEVKYHQALFEMLSKQYEAARIDEAKSAPVIQVVDRAIPPDKKSGPMRSLIVLGAGFVGFVCACIWCFAANIWRRVQLVPQYRVKIQQLQLALHLRK